MHSDGAIVNCNYQQQGARFVCSQCGDVRSKPVHRNCRAPVSQVMLEARRERQRQRLVEALPEESKQLLVGDRLAQMFAALGIPECGKCKVRKAWLNSAHQWVLGQGWN